MTSRTRSSTLPVPHRIVLDTNAISEMMKPQPDPLVAAWYLRQHFAALCTTSITFAETLFGLGIMPFGRRRSTLTELSRVIFEETLRGRVLPFDESAARHFGRLRSESQQRGRRMETMNAQIAAIALAANAAIATRNTADFEHCGVPLINPWLP